MNWDDLKNVWERQSLPEAKALDLATLEREFSAKEREMTRKLFRRDLIEAAAGFLAAGVFGKVGWEMGRDGWPIGFSVLLLLGLSGFFLRERVRVRRQRPGSGATLLERLDAEIAEQRRQRDMLSNVATWYVGPALLAGAIFGATVLWHAPIPLSARLAAGAIKLVGLALVGWFVVWLNRRAVQRVIEPRLQELEQWRQNLISSE